MNDHDLLITIKTKLEGVERDIKEMKDDTAKRVEKLEQAKMDKEAGNDHEVRIRRLERWGLLAGGALIIIQVAVGIYFK